MSALTSAYKLLYDNVETLSNKDHNIAPIKWQQHLFDVNTKRKLRIGYYFTDGKFQPHPGCSRAVKEAVALLRQMGHTVVEFHNPPEKKIVDLYMGLLSADHLRCLKDALDKDVLMDSSITAVWLSAKILSWPDFIRAWIINPILSLVTTDLLPSMLLFYLLTTLKIIIFIFVRTHCRWH